ncbi:MAG: mannose-1-phosphate guanylyltransferase/mannose-6-phosphate isomerase, partial [Deltaproteobacteria bacterium]|nr:mannose-1-phosphate guanylyltransferase/mannose-6-phosphate isomerase [Deltaproteobacteria bacterium]
AVNIEKFVEKPDLEKAKQYLDSGNYCWNSGMFMFKASLVIDELKKFVPDIVEACEKSLQEGREDLDFFRLDAKYFESCPSDSIDYALMEKTDSGAMVPLEAGWNDLGSWEALWQVGEKDENENVVHGDVLVHDVKNSYLHADNRMIAAVGLEDHIVVETSDAVLISPRNRVQDVKRIVDKLKANKRPEALSHKKVYRPWGTSDSIDSSDRFQVKRITVKPGARISLQKHFHRAEHWIVVRGTALVKKGEEKFILKEDESIYIPLGVTHRLENPGKIPLELIEVRSGSFLGEEDIVRSEDDYGRIKKV